MKTIRYAFWAIVGLCLILVGIANRELVTLQAMPTPLADLLSISPSIQLPLFVVIFLAVGAGLLIGFFWEWIREHRIRVDGRSKAREVDQLRKEISELRQSKAESEGDEILALIDAPSKT